jgi:GT2 family glycosyltransferase
MGFDRTVFDRVGGFDPKLQGAEELDFCWRAQYAGFTIGCAPDAVIAYRFRPGLRAAARQSFASGRGNAQLRALHIRLGKLPAQTRWQQGSLIKRYLLTLAHVQRLRGRVSRRRYLQDCAWFAGSLAGLARYGAIV